MSTWLSAAGICPTISVRSSVSLVSTRSYEDAVKTAVYFGYDTDTNGAITGSIAGAMYGTESIPARWLSRLKRREYLEEAAEAFAYCLEPAVRGSGFAPVGSLLRCPG